MCKYQFLHSSGINTKIIFIKFISSCRSNQGVHMYTGLRNIVATTTNVGWKRYPFHDADPARENVQQQIFCQLEEQIFCPRSDRKYNLYAIPDFLKILLRRNNNVSEGCSQM